MTRAQAEQYHRMTLAQAAGYVAEGLSEAEIRFRCGAWSDDDPFQRAVRKRLTARALVRCDVAGDAVDDAINGRAIEPARN